MYLRKYIVFIFFFLILLEFSITCQSRFDIYPRELTIKMDEEFIQGNTSRNITIINVEDSIINITWYLDDPEPISWIRPNRSLIPNLDWVDLNPKYHLIKANGNAKFDIFLNIPEIEENSKKQWETWIVFKEEENKFINYEATVRLLIDTPIIINAKTNNDFLSINIGDKIKIPVLDAIIFIIIIILISFCLYFIKNKRQKK
jgi:hypothetical protein